MAEGKLRINNIIVNPSTPVVGETIRITTKCENIGDADIVAGVIIQNTNKIFDDCYKGWGNDCIDLPGSTSSDRFWDFQGTFTMPDRDVIIIVITSHRWGYIFWDEDDRRAITISPGIAVCSSATIVPNKTSTNKCDTIKFTLQRNPAGVDKGHLIEVISNENYDRGSATTNTNGSCIINHIIRTPGAHTYYAYFESGCSSSNTTVNITDAGDLCSKSENCEWYDIICKIKGFAGDYWIWILLIIVIIVLLLIYLIITKFT